MHIYIIKKSCGFSKVNGLIERRVGMLGFKVVNRYYKSCVVTQDEVKYGRFWTYPNKDCGPLCVFTNYRDAFDWFAYAPTSDLICACEYDEYIGLNGVWNSVHTFPDTISTRDIRGCAYAKRVRLLSLEPVHRGWKVVNKWNEFNFSIAAPQVLAYNNSA